jgi:hypothetical protein
MGVIEMVSQNGQCTCFPSNLFVPNNCNHCALQHLLMNAR